MNKKEVKKLLPTQKPSLRTLWRDVPGPVKLAWLVFALLSVVAGGTILWAVVEVVSYLTSK
jgi:hypothetical protein